MRAAGSAGLPRTAAGHGLTSDQLQPGGFKTTEIAEIRGREPGSIMDCRGCDQAIGKRATATAGLVEETSRSPRVFGTEIAMAVHNL